MCKTFYFENDIHASLLTLSIPDWFVLGEEELLLPRLLYGAYPHSLLAALVCNESQLQNTSATIQSVFSRVDVTKDENRAVFKKVQGEMRNDVSSLILVIELLA